MKYDFSLTINNDIRDSIHNVQKFFDTNRTSTTITKIINLMYPYIKRYLLVTEEYIPIYENISWDQKIHICIDYKVYLLLKKIHDDTNSYSIAFIIRRILDFFIDNISKHQNIESFLSYLVILCKKNETSIKKEQFDVWEFMRIHGLKKMGRLILDKEKREFPLDSPHLSITHNKYYRSIGISFVSSGFSGW